MAVIPKDPKLFVIGLVVSEGLLPLKKSMEFSENNTLHRTVRRRIMTGSQSAFLALLNYLSRELREPRLSEPH